MRRWYFRWLIPWALSGSMIALSGCSGNDNAGARPISNTLRLLQPGDYYEYTIRGRASRPDVEPEDEPYVSGQVRVRISNALVSGEPTLRIEYLTTLRLGDIPYESRYALHCVQERNPRDLRLVAYEDETGEITPISPFTLVPGLWSVGYSQSYDGDFVYSLTTIGQDVVRTPLGKFTAWRCIVRSELRPEDPFANAIRTIWYAPQVGVPVVEQFQTTFPTEEGVWNLSITQQLTFTTVPIPDTNL